MPTLDIRTFRLTEEEQQKVAEGLTSALKSIVGDRVIDVYISAYETWYRKGVKQEEPSALISVLGAVTLNKDDFSVLTKNVYTTFIAAVNKPNMNVTFSYTPTNQDHLAVNGVLLADFSMNRLVK
jgi:phenylpyruvate tautomerase PptA (4-oxalocrotonate tautomerase family)